MKEHSLQHQTAKRKKYSVVFVEDRIVYHPLTWKNERKVFSIY